LNNNEDRIIILSFRDDLNPGGSFA
jgi:hypothetical protein